MRNKSSEVKDKRESTLLFQVNYGGNESEKINRYFEIAEQIFSGWSKQDVDSVWLYILVLTTHLITLLPSLKNEDYKDEHEWRVCLTRVYKNGEYGPYGFPIEKLTVKQVEVKPPSSFVEKVTTHVPRLELLEFEYRNIDSIYIGPRLNFLTAKLAVERVLLDAGISKSELESISIKKSDRSY